MAASSENRAARRLAAAVAVAGALLLPLAAHAAPTCLDDTGATVRCDAPNALPVGASPAPEQVADHDADIPLPSPQTLFGLICVLGGLFALIGLMPDFDGWGGDHEGRRKPD